MWHSWVKIQAIYFPMLHIELKSSITSRFAWFKRIDALKNQVDKIGSFWHNGLELKVCSSNTSFYAWRGYYEPLGLFRVNP